MIILTEKLPTELITKSKFGTFKYEEYPIESTIQILLSKKIKNCFLTDIYENFLNEVMRIKTQERENIDEISLSNGDQIIIFKVYNFPIKKDGKYVQSDLNEIITKTFIITYNKL